MRHNFFYSLAPNELPQADTLCSLTKSLTRPYLSKSVIVVRVSRADTLRSESARSRVLRFFRPCPLLASRGARRIVLVPWSFASLREPLSAELAKPNIAHSSLYPLPDPLCLTPLPLDNPNPGLRSSQGRLGA